MKILVSLITLLIVVACGTGGSSKVTDTGNKKELVLPSVLTIILPRKLEPNREMLTSVSTKSYSYETMQLNIIKYRDHSQVLSDELNIVSRSFGEIVEACQDMPLNEKCTLEADSISFNLTKRELRSIKKRYGYLEINFDVNSTLFFGVTSFVKYDNKKPYAYELGINLTKMYEEILGKEYRESYEESLEKREIRLFWSENEKDIRTILTFDTNESKQKIESTYVKAEDNQEFFHVLDESNSFDYSFSFRKYVDINNSYAYTFQNKNEFVKALFSDGTGYIVKALFSDNGQIITFFDKTGMQLGDYGCAIYEDCALDDKSTWGVELESEQNASALDATFQVYIRNIVASQSSLKNGQYFLLTKETNVSSLESMLAQRVGEFMVKDNRLDGVLYDKNQENNLRKLIIVNALSLEKIGVSEYPIFELQREVIE